jgi:hypothetical protein
LLSSLSSDFFSPPPHPAAKTPAVATTAIKDKRI